MRRLAVLALPIVLTLAACSSDSEDASTTTSNSTASSDSTPTSDATPATAPPLVPAVTPEGCEERTPTTTLPPLEDPVEKPEIDLPTATPTELETTDLTTGEGHEAALGDLVAVYYVGVLSSTGEEFDSNFGSGSPFAVELGLGQVIPGWEEGLVGVQRGTRRQLNIPAEMAYGETGSGDIIGPNEALTFIVDVVDVQAAPQTPAADPADEPDYEFVEVEAPAEFATEEIDEGDSCDYAQIDDRVYLNLKVVRGDTLDVVDNSWANGQAYAAALNDNVLRGIAQGTIGMRVGGTRVVTIPPVYGLGEEGNVQAGFEADTVMLAYIELIGIEGLTELPPPPTVPPTSSSSVTPASTSEQSDAEATATTSPATTAAP